MCKSRPISRVTEFPDAVVVLAQVVAEVQSGCLCAPREELLRHTGVVYLVHNYVELVVIGQGVHFYLATPHPVFLDVSDIVVYFLVIFYEHSVQVFVFLNQLHSFFTVLYVESFVSVKLVSDCSKETIAVSFYFKVS